MGTVKTSEALDARPRGVRDGQRVAPTSAVPVIRKSFPTLSLRLLVLPTTFHRKGRVGRVGRDRPASTPAFTVAPLRLRYGRGTTEARSAALAGGFQSTDSQEYQFDPDRALGTGPLEAPAHIGAVSIALGRPGAPRDDLDGLRRYGGSDPLTTNP